MWNMNIPLCNSLAHLKQTFQTLTSDFTATHHWPRAKSPGLLHRDGESSGEGETELGPEWEDCQTQHLKRARSSSRIWWDDKTSQPII